MNDAVNVADDGALADALAVDHARLRGEIAKRVLGLPD